MPDCEKCGRTLKASEKGLCPACQSEASTKKKHWGEIAGAVITAAGGILIYILTKGKAGKPT